MSVVENNAAYQIFQNIAVAEKSAPMQQPYYAFIHVVLLSIGFSAC